MKQLITNKKTMLTKTITENQLRYWVFELMDSYGYKIVKVEEKIEKCVFEHGVTQYSIVSIEWYTDIDNLVVIDVINLKLNSKAKFKDRFNQKGFINWLKQEGIITNSFTEKMAINVLKYGYEHNSFSNQSFSKFVAFILNIGIDDVLIFFKY